MTSAQRFRRQSFSPFSGMQVEGDQGPIYVYNPSATTTTQSTTPTTTTTESTTTTATTTTDATTVQTPTTPSGDQTQTAAIPQVSSTYTITATTRRPPRQQNPVTDPQNGRLPWVEEDSEEG